MLQEVDQVPRSRSAPRSRQSHLRRTWLANELGRRDHVTGTALQQGCDLDMPVIVQRQAPMSQTVLGASAVTAHRQGHRNSCLDAETDPSGSNDPRPHRGTTLTRRSVSLLSRIEQVPPALVELQTVAIPESQLSDRAVNVLWCRRERYRKSRRPLGQRRRSS